MFTVEQVITWSGRTGKKIAESRTNTDLVFSSYFVRLLIILIQLLYSDGGQ